MDRTNKEAATSYHVYAKGRGYVWLMAALYIPVFIAFWFVATLLDDKPEWVLSVVGLVMIIGAYFLVAYLARCYTHQPTRIRFDDEHLHVDTFSRDLQTQTASNHYVLADMDREKNIVITEEGIQLTFKNADVVRIAPSGWQRKDDDFTAFIEDFRTHVKTHNPSSHKAMIATERYFFSGWRGQVLSFLAVGGLLTGIGLLLLAIFGEKPLSFDLIKAPVTLIFLSLVYLARYYWDNDD